MPMRSNRFLAAALALGLLGCLPSAGADANQQDEDPTVIMQPERDDQGQIIPVEKTVEQWKAELSEQEFRILRESGTERAGTGRYLDNKADGIYACAGCGLALYDSTTKFNSGTGWPSFFDEIGNGDHVAKLEDRSHGMVRTEIRCARCNGHLGHVFRDGPAPTGLRHCVNGYSLIFVDRQDAAEPPTDEAEASSSAAAE